MGSRRGRTNPTASSPYKTQPPQYHTDAHTHARIHTDTAMRLVIAAISLGAALAADITLVSFTPNSKASHKFTELNDPVMGGKSTGTWTVDTKDGMGVFDGSVVDVPSLKAPGFIKASSRDAPFADASTAINGDLILTVRTSTPDYAGFRVSFASGSVSPSFACAAGGSLPFSRGCFKAKFSVPAGSDFTDVKIPFNTFSDKWSSATGEQTTTCAQNKDVCPTASKLRETSVLSSGEKVLLASFT